ncbi:alpha-methylacyl-CoA racemase [Nemania sp. FL0916]|nr:alpha-methylacyl-CoA racemase [Nemania sp. FL0916]
MAGPPPLQGLKVLEFAGLAPGPFAGLLLADAGAHVLRIDRAIAGQQTHNTTTSPGSPGTDNLTRHKASITVDLKARDGVALIKTLARSADVLIDPFRPGVLERLGLGPSDLTAINSRLIYARMSGFRRDGRYASMAGHDINYLAVSGVLSLLGRAGAKPHPPINMLGDFAGGGAVLFQGILLAVIARQRTGRGQVVEANMVDGANYIATFPRLAKKTHLLDRARGENVLDGGCPFYDTYATRDGKYMSVGALEPQFFVALVKGLGLAHHEWAGAAQERWDRASWPAMKLAFETKFATKTREEWERVFEGSDACCLPVLEYAELETDPSREGDQRPVVALQDTPLLAVDDGESQSQSQSPAGQGQGPGVPGRGGYVPHPLRLGEGGEEALKSWFGLDRGRDFDVVGGGLVLLKAKPNL